jgi:predicted ATPase/class 3 adenylate cyclase/DNA-binding CsgD family transcriptional regulator
MMDEAIMIPVGGVDQDAVAIVPTGTVTFLLTDVERSTSLWEEWGEVMAPVMARCHDLLGEVVQKRGGVRPEEQGEGDSAVAVFVRASDAVACALDLQRALRSEPWPERVDVRVRVALHTGDAVLRDPRNYTGPSIHRCARLRAIGHGGQTLLSRSTCELVAGALPDGVSVRDLGAHRLRDLARPEQVYQLCHADLHDDFGPLRSLSALPNNLPVQLTSFVGREAEITEVRELLSRSRLLTLTGAGGCGKTRLALQVAAEVLDDHPHGVWWVDLAPIGDSALVASEVAATLSIRELPSQPVIETLTAQLAERRLLIGLDNCEHLLQACAELAARLLEACPGVVILATSRESVGVEGEQSWRVPSLQVPEADLARSALAGVEAVQLFCDRARQARPNFRLVDANVQAVATICRRLDGIPLAIELAAARVRLLTPQEIADAMRERFVLLTGGSRTAMPRQRTLEASVDWSHDLLSAAEQTLFRRVSVFAGGWTLDAVEAVCAGGGLEVVQILDLLANLVDKSLVQAEERGVKTRYGMLETVRAYARQKLSDAAEAALVRNQHLDYHMRLAESAEPDLFGAGLERWLEPLTTELDNFRGALGWAVDAGSVDEARRLASALWLFFEARGHWREGRRHLESALAGEGASALPRAKALIAVGHIGTIATDWVATRRFAEEALAIGREVGDERTVGRALDLIGWALISLEPGAAMPVLEESIAITRPLGDGWFLADALYGAGFLATLGGWLEAAPPLLEDALAVSRAAGNLLGIRESLTWLGLNATMRCQFAQADAMLEEAFAQSRSLGDPLFAMFDLALLGFGKLRTGEWTDARALIEEAITLGRQMGHDATPLMVWYLGLLEYATGQLERAAALMSEALPTTRANNYAAASVSALLIAAAAQLARGETAPAVAAIEEAALVARESGNPLAIGAALEAQAQLAREAGEVSRAEELLHEALRAFHDAGDPGGVADVLESLAALLHDLHSDEQGVRLLGAADAARAALGCVRFPVRQADYEAQLSTLREALGEEAFAAAWSAGASLWLDDAVAYAERGRGERKRPSGGWDSLSPAELRVVRLVAEGLTNPQIGERLFISRRTVQAHLAHVFAKLGVASRAELAAQAARREL